MSHDLAHTPSGPASPVFGTPCTAVIALGANAGHRLASLQAAVDALGDTPGLEVTALSPVCESAPSTPTTPGAPAPYLHAIVVVRTALVPAALVERGRAVEEAFRHDGVGARPGQREIDVDLVSYDGRVRAEPGPPLPHPAAHRSPRVLVPWFCMDPAALLPGHGPVGELLAARGSAGVVPRRDLFLSLPD
ncbi:2-amino-4-hydroxy-6-hydroxymethyldihydropteridine diphosphokinase [Streptomyces sp. NPDC059917]|uniref:2-amino-4-hydroxy-6- hydroxymethyldihydropteridine diphosphokinase n=1 Tax=Streptomyces sp. NPDC059917 TaxID=3347002 RepID=UPI00364E49A0